MKRLLTIALLVVAVTGCSSTGKVHVTIDAADRSAYEAIRGFQNLEEVAWHAKAPWPTAAQHQQIGMKLSKAYDLVAQVATDGLAVTTSTAPADLVKEIADLEATVADIVALAKSAPTPITDQAATMKTKTNDLVKKVRK